METRDTDGNLRPSRSKRMRIQEKIRLVFAPVSFACRLPLRRRKAETSGLRQLSSYGSRSVPMNGSQMGPSSCMGPVHPMMMINEARRCVMTIRVARPLASSNNIKPSEQPSASARRLYQSVRQATSCYQSLARTNPSIEMHPAGRAMSLACC